MTYEGENIAIERRVGHVGDESIVERRYAEGMCVLFHLYFVVAYANAQDEEETNEGTGYARSVRALPF